MRDGTEALLGQLSQLACAGVPLGALRGVIGMGRRLRAAGGSPMAVGSAGGADALDRALQRILQQVGEALARPAAPMRALPSLLADVRELARWGGDYAPLAARIHDRLVTPPAGGGGAGSHFIVALIELVDHAVGLAVRWPWEPQPPEGFAHLRLEFDHDAEMQLVTAQKLMAALSAHDEQAFLGDFNGNRHIWPVHSLSLLGRVQGGSMGLPSFLAMLQARFDLRLERGTAATGVVDLKTMPSSPTSAHWDDAVRAGYLLVEVRRVEGIAAKIRAALEQEPGTRRILLPAENRSEIEAQSNLLADIESRDVELRYLSRVRDLFDGEAIFDRPLFAPPLRLDPDCTETEAQEIRRACTHLRATVRRCAAGLLLASAAALWLAWP